LTTYSISVIECFINKKLGCREGSRN